MSEAVHLRASDRNDPHTEWTEEIEIRAGLDIAGALDHAMEKAVSRRRPCNGG